MQALAPAPESATSNDRKRRAASGKGSSISAKKVCVGVEDFFGDAPTSAPPCELDESIAPVEIVADILTVCVTQPDVSTTPNERANVTSEVLEVSRLRIARVKPAKMRADAH